VLLAAGWLRDPATVAFVVAGGFCLWRCVSVAASRRPADRVGYGQGVQWLEQVSDEQYQVPASG
jgi:hypothetical protein